MKTFFSLSKRKSYRIRILTGYNTNLYFNSRHNNNSNTDFGLRILADSISRPNVSYVSFQEIPEDELELGKDEILVPAAHFSKVKSCPRLKFDFHH